MCVCVCVCVCVHILSVPLVVEGISVQFGRATWKPSGLCERFRRGALSEREGRTLRFIYK